MHNSEPAEDMPRLMTSTPRKNKVTPNSQRKYRVPKESVDILERFYVEGMDNHACRFLIGKAVEETNLPTDKVKNWIMNRKAKERREAKSLREKESIIKSELSEPNHQYNNDISARFHDVNLSYESIDRRLLKKALINSDVRDSFRENWDDKQSQESNDFILDDEKRRDFVKTALGDVQKMLAAVQSQGVSFVFSCVSPRDQIFHEHYSSGPGKDLMQIISNSDTLSGLWHLTMGPAAQARPSNPSVQDHRMIGPSSAASTATLETDEEASESENDAAPLTTRIANVIAQLASSKQSGQREKGYGKGKEAKDLRKKRRMSDSFNVPEKYSRVRRPFSSYDCVVMDIEGTTTPISFVNDILFPYVEATLERFIVDNWLKPSVMECVKGLREQAAADILQGVPGAVAIPYLDDEMSDHAAKDEIISMVQNAVVRNVRWQMATDRKTVSLKCLQGFIWKDGYASGDLKGQIYHDVVPALRQWQESGATLYIYSSGSANAQKLLFGNSDKGNLLGYFAGHFDTTTGPKTDPSSYKAIAKAIDCSASRILFISDNVNELLAARKAGYQVALADRPGNIPVSPEDRERYLSVDDFTQLCDSPEDVL